MYVKWRAGVTHFVNRPQWNCAFVEMKRRRTKDGWALAKPKQDEGLNSSPPLEGMARHKNIVGFSGTLRTDQKEKDPTTWNTCITSPRKRRTQESYIRKNGKSNAEVLERALRHLIFYKGGAKNRKSDVEVLEQVPEIRHQALWQSAAWERETARSGV